MTSQFFKHLCELLDAIQLIVFIEVGKHPKKMHDAVGGLALLLTTYQETKTQCIYLCQLCKTVVMYYQKYGGGHFNPHKFIYPKTKEEVEYRKCAT